MSATPLQIHENSVDMFGVSIATALPSPTDARVGALYTPNGLAACVPIYAVPLSTDLYLLMFSRRWLEGVPGETHPGYYTSYTISSLPGWVIFNASHGTTVGPPSDIPLGVPADDVILTAVAAMPPYYTYLLNTVIDGDDVTAVVQHIFYQQTLQDLQISAEETIPNAALMNCPADVIINLGDDVEVVLNTDLVARIFNGTILRWNDPAILALNLGVDLPDLPINVIYPLTRSTLTRDFQIFLGGETNAWPVGASTRYLGGAGVGSYNVAASVASTPRSIGYVAPGVSDLAVPVVNPVRFDRGMYLDQRHLYVFGATQAGTVCLARKPWDRIGFDTTDWEYFDGNGFDTSPTSPAPVRTSAGEALTTVGPISVATYKNRVWIAVTVADGDDRIAKIYGQDSVNNWEDVGISVDLGSTADGSYQGATLQFQDQLSAVGYMVDTPDSEAAIPCCVTTKKFATGESALDVVWGLMQVPRLA